MDMMLQLIDERHGSDLARRVANQFHHDRIRDARDTQSGGRLERLGDLPLPVRTAIGLMQRHVEHPISIAEIAARIGLSTRQVERLFLRDLRMSAARYYITIRRERARELLLYSDRPILDVAVATGFASPSHFARWFKRLHGLKPSQLRGRVETQRAGEAPLV